MPVKSSGLLCSFCFVGMVLLLTSPAAAADRVAVNCDDFGALDQVGMNICAARDLEAAERDLDVRYRALLARPDYADFKADIEAAQQAWLKYRDAQCGLEATDMEGGSARSEYFARCQTKKTRARIDELDPDQWIVARP